jgi:hypothetical protein
MSDFAPSTWNAISNPGFSGAPDLTFLSAIQIPQPFEGIMVFVVDTGGGPGSGDYYYLSLTSGAPVLLPTVVSTSIGGASRWLKTDITNIPGIIADSPFTWVPNNDNTDGNIRSLRQNFQTTGPGIVGGNAFGSNSAAPGSVDVTGNYATVGGGNQNKATANHATVAGGLQNTASGVGSTVGGGINNNATAAQSAVVGGNANAASGANGFVGGGVSNTAAAGDGAVVGGSTNTVNAGSTNSAVLGGLNNLVNSVVNSVIAGGSGGNVTGNTAGIVAGTNGTASGVNSLIGGGSGNTASNARAAAIGGDTNVASGTGSCVAGGTTNTVSGINAFGTGEFNTCSGESSTVTGDDHIVSAISCLTCGTSSNVASTANYSFASGSSAQAKNPISRCHGGGFFGGTSLAGGLSQFEEFPLAGTTTGGGANQSVVMKIFLTGPNPLLVNGVAYLVTIELICSAIIAAAKKIRVLKQAFAIECQGGAVTIIANDGAQISYGDAAAVTFAFTVAASGATGIAVTFSTGVGTTAQTNVQGKVSMVEAAFPA